jgi:hypothetical protein
MSDGDNNRDNLRFSNHNNRDNSDKDNLRFSNHNNRDNSDKDNLRFSNHNTHSLKENLKGGMKGIESRMIRSSKTLPSIISVG